MRGAAFLERCLESGGWRGNAGKEGMQAWGGRPTNICPSIHKINGGAYIGTTYPMLQGGPTHLPESEGRGGIGTETKQGGRCVQRRSTVAANGPQDDCNVGGKV